MKTFCIAALVGTTTAWRTVTDAELATSQCTEDTSGEVTVGTTNSGRTWEFHSINTNSMSSAWHCDVTLDEEVTSISASYRVTAIDPSTLNTNQHPDDNWAMTSWGVDAPGHSGYFSFGTPTTIVDPGNNAGSNVGYTTAGNQENLTFKQGDVTPTNIVRFGWSQSFVNEAFSVDNINIQVNPAPTPAPTPAPSVECTAQEYESKAPVAGVSDRECSPLTVCTASEYESKAPVPGKSDRKCKTLTQCGGPSVYRLPEIQLRAPTRTSDRACFSCDFEDGRLRSWVLKYFSDSYQYKLCNACVGCSSSYQYNSANALKEPYGCRVGRPVPPLIRKPTWSGSSPSCS